MKEKLEKNLKTAIKLTLMRKEVVITAHLVITAFFNSFSNVDNDVDENGISELWRNVKF